MTEEIIPNPGSDEAILLDCACPALDNYFGKGRPTATGREFIYTAGCPIHKFPLEKDGKEKEAKKGTEES